MTPGGTDHGPAVGKRRSEMRTSDNRDRDMTVSDIIEDVKNAICDDYCKYPDEYGPAGFDDMIAEKCEDCPLGRQQI